MPNNPKKPRAKAAMWTFTQAAVVTEAGTFTGWNIPMMMKHSPATTADKPAKRMRVDEVMMGLLSVLDVFPLAFICFSPFGTYKVGVKV
jgi:hypothetical protein